LPKPEKVKFEVTLERPLDGKGKSVGYGQLAAYVKEAIEQHGVNGSITEPLTKVRVQRVVTA